VGSCEFFGRNHLGDNSSDFPGLEVEHGTESGHGDSVVKRCVSKEICAQAFYLDLVGKHLFYLFGLRKEIPDFDGVYEGG